MFKFAIAIAIVFAAQFTIYTSNDFPILALNIATARYAEHKGVFAGTTTQTPQDNWEFFCSGDHCFVPPLPEPIYNAAMAAARDEAACEIACNFLCPGSGPSTLHRVWTNGRFRMCAGRCSDLTTFAWVAVNIEDFTAP